MKSTLVGTTAQLVLHNLGLALSVGRQIDLAVETCSILLPQLRDGKMRPLGTPSPKRLDALPDVPTMAENGVPGFTASSWTGIVAPPGTPRPIIDKLNRATNTALKGPATQAKLKPLEAQAMFGTPADYARLPHKRTAEMDRDGEAVGRRDGVNQR